MLSSCLIFLVFLRGGLFQDQGNINHILTSTPGLSRFAAIVQSTDVKLLLDGASQFTVFAFNDTAYNELPASRKAELNAMSQTDKDSFIRFFIVSARVVTGSSQFSDQYIDTISSRRMFLSQKTRTYWSSTGSTGPTAYYANGAMLIREGIQATNGLIHVLDRIPMVTTSGTAYDYLSKPEFSIFNDLLKALYTNHYDVIRPMADTQNTITLFLPSNTALSLIPANKRLQLMGQPNELKEYIKMHYISGKVIFTSIVDNNQKFPSGNPNAQIVFRQASSTYDTYVIGGDVSAAVLQGNITVFNGVVHVIDRIFGYAYFTAMEQINADAQTMASVVARSSAEVSNEMTQPSGVTVLVPTEQAFSYIRNLYGVNLNQNQTLTYMIVTLHMLQRGETFVVSNLPVYGDYRSRQYRRSRYNQNVISIYNERNETWVQGGYVKAKIVRPDVKVTNGYLQYIDAVLGVPNKDIANLIYYDDWLLRTYLFIDNVGLADFLKDPRFDATRLPPRGNVDSSYYQNQLLNNNVQNPYQYTTRNPYLQSGSNNMPTADSMGQCGSISSVCQFSFFVPNGTAIDLFQMTTSGFRLMQDPERFRFVLRRMLFPGLIFLDMMQAGERRSYRAHNGDIVNIVKESDTVVRLVYGSSQAEVLTPDLGATNGVIHIVSAVLSQPDDMTRDISHAARLLFPVWSYLLLTVSSLVFTLIV
ncbi:hypothetical protein ACJMK2_024499 [Sinanodonta woodiana]|uniref:FAS1 domain-containing protein n=1 Tax=Sinanodonta woodiana TaxID=1069815 RepID=A0ABD3XHH2_SINWO